MKSSPGSFLFLNWTKPTALLSFVESKPKHVLVQVAAHSTHLVSPSVLGLEKTRSMQLTALRPRVDAETHRAVVQTLSVG